MSETKRTQEEIHSKGFNVYSGGGEITNYGKIKIGPKTFEDITINFEEHDRYKIPYRHRHKKYAKRIVLQAISEKDVNVLRDISQYFYDNSGIYSRVCNYLAFLFKYDWYIMPEIFDDNENEKTIKKIKTEFLNILNFLENSHIQKVCGDIALEVIKTGVYYGYLVQGNNNIIIQQLPAKYCRSRYKIADIPVIEFNMAFFDACFKNVGQRMKVLKLFPKDFQRGYALYKQGKLDPDYECGMGGCWYPLEYGSAVKFNLGGDNSNDLPILINAIPSIIDLGTVQDLDRKKQFQELQKILIQQLPLDKNGDLIFDVEEAFDIHQNAKEMVSNLDCVDVLTTFADISVEDVAENKSADDDDLENAERQAYNELGVPKMLFNADSSAALDKSIRVDVAMMRQLLLQFDALFDKIVQSFSKNKKKYNFKFYMLETTAFNFEEMSDEYRKQTSIGYSKMLPQIALGHSQLEILSTAKFENEVLELYRIMIPPMQSSTMSPEQILGKTSQSSDNKSESSTDGNVGRPELKTEDKSEKTIANIESA